MAADGYVSGSDGWAAAARWRVAGQELDGAALWPALRKPESVAKALRGEKLPEPSVKR